MESQSYYRLLGVSDNICRMDTPLCVNCAGLCVMRQPFISHFPTGREDFYLQYMVDGEMDILLDGKLGILRPGEAVLHFPHTEYWYAMRGEQPWRIIGRISRVLSPKPLWKNAASPTRSP